MAQIFPDVTALGQGTVRGAQFFAPLLGVQKENTLAKRGQLAKDELLSLFDLTKNSLLHLTNLSARYRDKKISYHAPLAALLQYVGIARYTLSDSINSKDVITRSAARSLEILKKLKFSNADIKQITDLIENQEIFRQAQNQKISAIKRWLQKGNFWNNLFFFQAKQLALTPDYSRLADLNSFQYLLNLAESLSKEEITPLPLITGNDLIEIGLRPGPVFSGILKKIEEEQLQGNLKTKKEALIYARSLIS
jgi:hypothetical protein